MEEPFETAVTASRGSSPADILRARARALATILDVEEITDSLEVIQFHWGQETYALESRYVREAYRLRDITRIPCTPNWILGLVNVRSQVMAVVDLRTFLGLPAPPPQSDSRLLILQDETGQFGVPVDSINGVRQIPQADVDTANALGPGVRAEYVAGLTAERLILLNGQAILSDQRLEVNV